MTENQKKVLRVLVVEDEISMLRILSDNLANEGLEVYEAKDGERGLWLALLEHPDLILLDILMPKKDSMRMLKELRKDDWGKRVPVIILTNLNDNGKIAESMGNGVYDYLIKSDCRLEEIVDRVKAKLFREI